jgi:hypothetical protein
MMQTDINAKIDIMILWIPPTRIDDLVCVCRGIYGAICNAVVHTVVTVISDPVGQTV